MDLTAALSAHNKTTYSANVQMVAQQLKSGVRETVTIVPATGESKSVADLFGKKKAQRGADRSRTNPDITTERSRRMLMRPPVIETGEYIDTSDKFDHAMDPSSMLMRANVSAIERGIEDIIFGITEDAGGSFSVTDTGIFGKAHEGKRGATQVSLPAAQYIAANATGLTLDKLREVRKKLRKNEFGLDGRIDPISCGITPDQEDDLLAIAAASGANLNTFNIEQLREGVPTRLMGFTWVMTNRLPVDSSGNRLCPVWTKANIAVGMWQDVKGEMWNDPHAKNLPYIYASAYADAVRIEDKGVFAIRCVES